MKTVKIKKILYCMFLAAIVRLQANAALITVPEYIEDVRQIGEWQSYGDPYFPGPPAESGTPGMTVTLSYWNSPVLIEFHNELGSFTCDDSALEYIVIDSWDNIINYIAESRQTWNWRETGHWEDHGYWEDQGWWEDHGYWEDHGWWEDHGYWQVYIDEYGIPYYVWVPDIIWIPNPVWIPNQIWVPNMVWVPSMVWISDGGYWENVGFEEIWSSVEEWKIVQQAIPEPMSIVLLSLGGCTVLVRRKK